MSQDITKNIINNCFKDYHFALLTRTLNINYVKDIMKIISTIESTDILMLQNCLNELETNQMQSINFLLDHQPERSLLLINDLRDHRIAQYMIQQIQARISDAKLESKRKYNQEIFRQFAGDNDFKSCLQIPSILRENLLTGEDGLIPRKRINYKYLSIYKIFTKQSNLFEQSIDSTYINLLEQVNRLQTQFNNFDARLEQLLAVESNYLQISDIVESYDQKLEEFQANLQKISNQQEILEREKQNFNNLADNLDVKIQLLESSNDEFRSLNLSSSLETLRYNIQNLELIDSEQARKLEEFQTTLQEQKDTIQADLETFKSYLQNLETKNSKQEIKLGEIEDRLNHFIHEERKNLTRQLERNRKAVIFAILIGLLGVILGVIALFR
jgi:DNA repair exonuclease SbcCD ATPase subunit